MVVQAHAAATDPAGIDLDVVREIVSHFKPQDHQEAQELILAALQEVNERFGYVSLEAAEIVAAHLGTTANRVYGLLTFYADFRTEPRGKHFMLVCHGMSCYALGSQALVQELKDRWGIADGGTTADGELTIQVVNGCLGVCDKAPIVELDHAFHGDLTVERLNDVIQRAIAARNASPVAILGSGSDHGSQQ
ncbi:MAG: NADH dehydrogenase (ubiquinone), 24 kDa subunit [uncultured Thermomicrobiales bacterium]|uniref:NADH dehydrogenase (Ubiquinone), 24 kDa subunit n=1 Tax=uncultured Thermomicrobiales bacterium TaxID=1645740 RepID=A0A6J4UEM5_9BACT|nr:MAG: NADH dehydrogenase (ubiquinone), 24 kDa subunit [uncultured Thermomicrobiales bacterium]